MKFKDYIRILKGEEKKIEQSSRSMFSTVFNDLQLVARDKVRAGNQNWIKNYYADHASLCFIQDGVIKHWSESLDNKVMKDFFEAAGLEVSYKWVTKTYVQFDQNSVLQRLKNEEIA